MKQPLLTQSIVCVGFLALLSGCSSTPEQEKTVSPQELVQMKADIEELKKMKPGLQRMTRMEGDLKTLIGHLNSLVEQSPTAQLERADTADNVEVAQLHNPAIEERQLTAAAAETAIAEPKKAEPSSTAPEVTLEKPSAPAVTEMTAATEVPVENNQTSVAEAIEAKYAIQLASITNPALLNATWTKLQRRYPQQLASLQPSYEKQQVASRQYYRVKAGAFSTYQDASALCEQLISNGASCIVGKSVSNYYSSL